MARKTTKEKILPYSQQVARIKAFLTNRWVDVRTGEIEDHMSPDLHYDENKRAVLEVYGKKKRRKYGSVETLMEQAHARDDARSERSQTSDYRRCATRAFMPKEVADDIKKAQRWFDNPNRCDIIGVDAKASCPRPKKKTKRTKK